MDSSRLLKESPLYKEVYIQVDTSWLDSIHNLGDDDRELVTGLGNDSNLCRESQAEGESEVNQIYSTERPEANECDPNEMSDDDAGITFTEDDDNLAICVIDMGTMLDDYEPIIPQADEPLFHKN